MGLVDLTRILSFISVIALTWVAGAKWPSGIKRCALNDPNLDKCLLKQSEQAMAKMAKGVPAIGLKSLDPLRNISFDIASKTGPVVLNIHATNTMINGPSKVQMKKVHFDEKTSTYFIEGYHNFIKMVGDYKVKGTFLLVPIDSSGKFEYELRGGFANHTLNLSNNVRSKGHGKVRFDLKTVKSMKLTVHDRLLGEQGSAVLSQLVNDNIGAFSKAMWDPMERAVKDIFADALRPLTSKFNARDFLPVTSSGRSEADDVIMEDTEESAEKTPYDDPVQYSYQVQY